MSEEQKTKNQNKAVKLEKDKSLSYIECREDDDSLITNPHPWKTKSFEELRKEAFNNKTMIKRSKEFNSNKVYRARSVGTEFVAKCQDCDVDTAYQKFDGRDGNGKQMFKLRLSELGTKFNEKLNKCNEEKDDKPPNYIKNTNRFKCNTISNPRKPSCNFFDKWKRMKKSKCPIMQQNKLENVTFWESLSNKSLKTIIHLQDHKNVFVASPKVNLKNNDLDSQESEYSECTETSTCNVHDKKLGLDPKLLEEIAPYILGFTKCFLNDFRNFLLTGYKKLDKISLEHFELMVKAVESFPTNDMKFNNKTLDKCNHFNNTQNSNSILTDKNNINENVSDEFPKKAVSLQTKTKILNKKCSCKIQNSYGNHLLNHATAKEFQDLYNKYYPFPVKLYRSVMVQTNSYNESLIVNGC